MIKTITSYQELESLGLTPWEGDFASKQNIDIEFRNNNEILVLNFETHSEKPVKNKDGVYIATLIRKDDYK